MKKIFALLFGLLICIFVSIPAFAENFFITNYDVNINVDKNKTAHVTEEIDVYFTVSSHGIYRTIPLKEILFQIFVFILPDLVKV